MASKIQVHPADSGGASATWPEVRELTKLVEERPGFKFDGGIVQLAEKLGTDLEKGLPTNVDVKQRIRHFGKNAFAEKELNGYLYYLMQALHDKLIIMLIIMATAELVLKMAIGPDKKREDAWIEPVAIYVTVLLIINVQSVLDYRRERMFDALTQKLASSNLRFIIRGGEQLSVPDEQIVVGDIVSFNSHMAAVIPADCILIAGDGVKTEEGALTGEPEPIPKSLDEDPFMISGTTVNSGSGKMMVVAVGENSVSGRIRAQVYAAEDDEESPLFAKLDKMAGQIGMLGMVVAAVCFIASCIKGISNGNIEKEGFEKVLDYIIVSLGILAVAIPEGLPLALTISLAFSSNKLAAEFNLVKTLDSCETMGSATTICTDKTGTLTANRMTVRGAFLGSVFFPPDKDASVLCGTTIKNDSRMTPGLLQLTSNLVSCASMDESQVRPPPSAGAEHQFMGNPSDCACLKFAGDLGFDYNQIRSSTDGRSESTAKLGKCNALTSARKMMSWAVPKPGGGCIVYVKGASEIVLQRSLTGVDTNCAVSPLGDKDKEYIFNDVIQGFANQAMRAIGLAFREMDDVPGDEVDNTILNADGSPAFACETQLTLLGVLGIEDPLRPEVPPAIQKCYTAGIDVRMVTGDHINTAIAIAKGCGILRNEDFENNDINGQIKKYRAITGENFRKHVHLYDDKGVPFFLQEKFDEIWPYLRVMARSSPDDKLTLAKGLMASRIYEQTGRMKELRDEGITIFPDGQVVAMTGDGTNDAPALKAATVGFAMGIAGTQIAKDAANIILLNDNFASIVTAAKWGRNVYDCIQKFLQFQLTVNCAILVISLIVVIGSGSKERAHPLPVTQMLWLNLIMDSLAALALASEPPSDEQLKRPPVNRSTPIITDQMVWNMLGQATYQIVVVSYLFFDPTCFPDWEDDKREDDGTRAEGPYTYHYTMIFNTFVLMQLFNQYNSRFLKGEWNILVGVHKNTLFLVTSWTTFALQVLMANFAGKFMKIHDPFGLTGRQWLMCLGLGVGPLFWQLVINCCTRAIAYFVRAWDIRGLSGLLKFGGPSNNSYRTSMPHRSSSARQNSGKISSASRIL